MTPDEYLRHLRRLARKRDSAGILAFARANLTEEMLDEMTPQQRRQAISATHVAAQVLGGGGYGPPTGIRIDEIVDAVS
jgi:hypothetical protein